MTAHPEMVAGTGRICTQLMAAFDDRIFCKSGASAFYAVGIKDKGIGIALKMEDGASSIVPYAILSVLTQLGVITPEEACSLPRYHDKNLYNNHHAVVGRTELALSTGAALLTARTARKTERICPLARKQHKQNHRLYALP